MSRVANSPVNLPSGVSVELAGSTLNVKGGKGTLNMDIHDLVEVSNEDNVVTFKARNGSQKARALAGTTRALVNNMVIGVSTGFERKLELVGVGYRAKATGNTVNLTVGLSHNVDYELAAGLSAETPTQTEIVIRGIDKQAVGQAAAEIRSYRPPEPYKGKGIRYADEFVRRKEAKKK